MARFDLAVCVALAMTSAVAAEDLGGGQPASHGRVVRFVMESWIPGQPSALTFVDLPPTAVSMVAVLSTGRTSLSLGPIGTLIADPTAPGAIVTTLSASTPLALIPASLAGSTLYIQGLILDSNGAELTDATRVDLFTPVAMVGNQRQSSNSISVLDLTGRSVTQSLTNSENGSITYSPDRHYAYVCEPGSQRNRVVVYDLTQSPIAVATTIPVSGGIRYHAAITRDGKRLYVPVHNAISVVDTDPTSGTFHTEVTTIPVPITGSSGTIFTGPLDVAVTPDGDKLYIAYGEMITGSTATVGVVDLNLPGQPHRSIFVTAGGIFFGLSTRNSIAISADGAWVYVGEYGVDPGTPFVTGFQNGALISVISTAADQEAASIPTGGTGQNEIALDRLGRNLYVPQLAISSAVGQVLRIDVDRRSQNRFQVAATIQVDPTAYSTGAGPLGVDVTPDGATVVVSVAEDFAHGTPQVVTIDSRTDQLFGTPIPVGSLCATVAVQQF